MDVSKISLNQQFDNYKKLCEFLNEPIKSGASKKAQIKEWERYVNFEKIGNKYIVKEKYDKPLDKIRKERAKETKPRKKCEDTSNYKGNNNKNILAMVKYLQTIDLSMFKSEYFSWSTWSTDNLKILNSDVCQLVDAAKEEIETFCFDNEIKDIKLLKDYIISVKYELKSLTKNTLKYMKRLNMLEYSLAYKFVFGTKNKVLKSFISTEINEKLIEIEEYTSDEINKPKGGLGRQRNHISSKLSGRQLITFIYQKPHYKEKFIKQVFINLLKDEETKNLLKFILYHENCEYLLNENDEWTIEPLNYFEILQIIPLYEKTEYSDEYILDVIKILQQKVRTNLSKKGYQESDLNNIEKILFLNF